MFVVTVDFEVKPEHAAQFCEAVTAQARNSLERETQCLRFDVSVDRDDASHFFLYELYADQPAFQSHMNTEHFHHFDQSVRDWVLTKTVRSWTLIAD